MISDDTKTNDIGKFDSGSDINIGQFNIIGDNVSFGKNVTIGHHCIIEDNVEIGDNTTIENYVLLKQHTVIKNNVLIDSYVRSSGDNTIGNNVTIRYGVTIARRVYIHDGAFISPNVMTIYITHTGEKSQGTVLKSNCFIGTAAVIGSGVTIGEDVVIGAMAYVSKDCLEKGIYVGVPAKLKGRK